MVAAAKKLWIQEEAMALLVGKFARLPSDLGFPTRTCWRARPRPSPDLPRLLHPGPYHCPRSYRLGRQGFSSLHCRIPLALPSLPAPFYRAKTEYGR